jgi:hypothetical protein
MRALYVLALLLLCGAVRAGEVIAHPSVRLDTADVRDVYLGERQLSGDLRLVPVDNLVAQEEFLAAILQTNLRSYQARWTRKTFREGVRAPLVKGSDAEVSSFVRATPGAIGYVSGSAGAGVIVLARF